MPAVDSEAPVASGANGAAADSSTLLRLCSSRASRTAHVSSRVVLRVFQSRQLSARALTVPHKEERSSVGRVRSERTKARDVCGKR